LAVELDLPRSSSYPSLLDRARGRHPTAPSSVELSAEAAELVRTVDVGFAKPLCMAVVGAAPWDTSIALRPIAGGALPHVGTSWTRRATQLAKVEGSSTLASADAIVIGDPLDVNEKRRPGSSALAEACTTVAEAAVEGQVIIVASTSYVGSTREFLVRPLERRGFVIGQDVHVAFSAALPDVTDGQARRAHFLGGATAACAEAALAIVSQLGAVEVASSLEEAESTALAGRPRSPLAASAKRAIDVAVAVAGILFLLPILALVALAIALDDGRPIFFTQDRVGQHGHRFRVWKFRTMVDGAEGRLQEVLALSQISGPGFQLDWDPRVTRVGRVLRRSSLDELPQLWNVLRGDMSLVGPRPAPPVEVAAYEPWHRRRLAVKPGITGLAQIRARSYRDFDVKATQDLEYVDQWSLWLDLKIMLLTGPTVLRFTGR